MQNGKKAANTDLITLPLSYSNTSYFFNIRVYRTAKTVNGWAFFNSKTTSAIICGEVEEYGYWITFGY